MFEVIFAAATPSLAALTGKPTDLLYRLHVLLFDLRHFNREDSRKRLDAIADISYIGLPYFSEAEAEDLKNTMSGGKTLSSIVEQELAQELAQRFERRARKRIKNDDFRTCTAHDIAPILARTLDIDLNRLEKDQRFLHLVNTKGLELDGEKWEGLPAKSFAPKQKNRKKT
ncbi:hypothetical protein BDV59DRAFT_192784 [Aspergillus ambiguus]|uniref:uncharacterized protein n=1 Tax=Aspergillus ambiguus TaxID=176160 RepID=UPI003CCDD470